MSTPIARLSIAMAFACICMQVRGAGAQTTPKPAAPPPTATAPTTTPKAEPAAPKIPLTSEEIKASVDAGEYRPALEGITRILDPKHTVDYDRTAMLMLRAECYLQLKQNIPAMDCLDGIRKKAHEDASKKDEAQAAAMIFLIRNSPGYKYTPKTGDDKIPTDILDRSKRSRAYGELYIDQLAVTRQTAKEAAFGNSLVPVIKVCDVLYSVQAVERINTDSIKQTSEVAQQLIKSSALIITTAENDFNAQIVRISRAANGVATVQRGMNVRNGQAGQRLQNVRVGVSVTDQHTLSGIETQCDGIRDVISTLRVLADEPEALAVLYERAAALKGNAQIVLDGGDVTPLPPVGQNKRQAGG